jgi:tetratricopeptide (TPR) repeat protein
MTNNMKKPSNIKIVLNAMVGNEENTITRMLESTADYIDYYVIQCNGKVDNTRKIIDDFYAERNIPGFTYEIDWQFPGINRDHTLQTCLKADHGCDWILRMDADEQLLVDDTFDWTVFEDLSIDSFNVPADAGDSIYFRTWMWNADRPWYFTHDKRHETIHLPVIDEGFQRVSLDRGFRHYITNDGETWDAPMKFLTDALELEKDKVPSNLVLEDNYHLFYIGKSYSDSYGNPNELPFGKEHADEYARRAIFYFNMYINKLHNYKETQRPATEDDMGYYAMYLIARAYEFIGDNEMALECYSRSLEFSPRRNEAIYSRAELFERMGQYKDMLAETTILVHENRPHPFPEVSFLVHNSAYYNTNPLPLWLHLKALKANGMDMTATITRLESLHSDLPEYITSVYSNIEDVTVLEDIETANKLSGVFGITR